MDKSPNSPLSLVKVLIIIATIGVVVIFIGKATDKLPIKLVAEDYSLSGGTTPERYLGIAKVAPMDRIDENYKTVYHGVTEKFFDCDMYKKNRKFKNFVYCSDSGGGNTEIFIFSNHLPETEIFRVTDWDIK